MENRFSKITNIANRRNLYMVAIALVSLGMLVSTGLLISKNNKPKNQELASNPMQQVQNVQNAQMKRPDFIMPPKAKVPAANKAATNAQPPSPNKSTETDKQVAKQTNQTPNPETKSKVHTTSEPKDINNVLANAFTQGNGITISNVSWEVSVSLASDPIFKNYLLVTGQAIKMALSKDLLLAKSNAVNNQIKVQLILNLKGDMVDKKIIQSSGSQEIDQLILQTLNNTFRYTKLPEIRTSKRFIKVTIIINL